MDSLSLFVFNVLVNSLLSFGTTCLLVFFFCFACRLKQKRVRAFLYAIPLFKLPFDLFCYDFSRWSHLHAMDPVLAEKGTRVLGFTLAKIDSLRELFFAMHSKIGFFLDGGMTFSVADVLAHYIDSRALLGVSAVVVIGSVFCLFRFAFQYVSFTQSLPRKGGVLAWSALHKEPLCAGLFRPKVYLPKDLSHWLTRDEYRAVLAHEVEHVRHKDPLFRWVLLAVRSLFWWVPTRWLVRRIERLHELAADEACCQRGVNPLDLASAMHRLLIKPASSELKPVLYFSTPFVKTRVLSLQEMQSSGFAKRSVIRSALAVWLVVSIGFLGKYWLF